VTSKLLATLVSMTAAYVGHRYWSFAHRERTGLGRGYAVFAVINGVTLALGLGIVAFVRYALDQDSALVLQLANIGSIVVGTVIRYVSYRRLLFTAPAGPAPAVVPDAGLGLAYRAAPATGNS
jgi:putative flippase GtrA